jgi:hypothetical protein
VCDFTELMHNLCRVLEYQGDIKEHRGGMPKVTATGKKKEENKVCVGGV